MIKLVFQEKPKELTTQKQKKLTTKFKKDGSSVWKQKWIAETLLRMSNGKCCFCESKLNRESNYLEVEHFYLGFR